MRTDRKINVLQLVEGFSFGGAEKKLLELVDNMDRKRFSTVVCSLGLGDALREQFEQLDAQVIVLPRHRRVDPTLLVRLYRLIQEKRIDVVMTTLFHADVMGALIGKLAGAKAVFAWETISHPKWLTWWRYWAYRFAIQFADQVIAVSQATGNWLSERRGISPSKVSLIPYGVDLKLYNKQAQKAVRRELGIKEDDPVVGMTSRLTEQKGHIYLVEAAEEIVERFPNCRFVIAGDGELRSFLEKAVAERNLASNFLFLGFRHDLHRLFSAFDVFTLPSLYEGLPNVVLEAMATSLPVVATPVDGTKEAVVDGETGILVSVKQPDKLARAIVRLLENPDLAERMGKSGRQRVEKMFSLEKQVSSFESLYEKYVN